MSVSIILYDLKIRSSIGEKKEDRILIIENWRSKTTDRLWNFLADRLDERLINFQRLPKVFGWYSGKRNSHFRIGHIDVGDRSWWQKPTLSPHQRYSRNKFRNSNQQNLYQELIRRFVPNKKEGKFIHRIKKLHRKINWEIERCPAAGVAVSQINFSNDIL